MIDLVGKEGRLKNCDQEDNPAEDAPLPVSCPPHGYEDENEGQENGEDGEQRYLKVTYLTIFTTIDISVFRYFNATGTLYTRDMIG
jgi:hypothetical protein